MTAGTIDKENVTPTFQTQIGSPFSDRQFFGTPGNDVMDGLGGNDRSPAASATTASSSATTLDGADDYHGGPTASSATRSATRGARSR